MESLYKRSRSDNGGYGSNYRNPEQQDWNYFQQSNGGGDLECRRFNTPEGCTYGTSYGRDISQPSMASGGKPKPCMKFFSTSGCPFGVSCHFLHYVPGGLGSLGLTPVVSLSAASAISQRKSVQPIGEPSLIVSGYKTKLCNRFNTPEGCRFGDRCHFAHGESDLRPSNNFSRGSNRRSAGEGPNGVGPSGFGGPELPNSKSYGNASNLDSQGYSEPNPPGVAGDNGASSHQSEPVGDNVQVY
ncbi:zinc finger CCCH domain-containing protein 44-like isoform X2 [Aristolochia californica]|uniref:zinc finger CCCH domain-containing protein 44-like isoform X2 n=1 Tax=Aristolochia californica TaxID=171875 RepID=UPI0035D67E7B